MEGFRFHGKSEYRWFVAFLRYFSQQRETRPSRAECGPISSQRKKLVREHARQLLRDYDENTKNYPLLAAERLQA